MKSICKSIFVLISLSSLFLSCKEGSIEPVRLLEIRVFDTLGLPVDEAKVELYFTEIALQTNGAQVIETLYTNKDGIVQVALDVEIFDYYVNIEKGELNNWYTNTFVNLPNLTEENVATIIINNSFQGKLTGKNKKRWQQTDDILNGNPSFPSCANQLYHDFIRRAEISKNRRDGELERYQTEICTFPGTLEGINQWVYDEQNNTITFGTENFTETYQVAEFTGDKMSLVFTTADGAFVKEKRYKLIE